MKTKIEVEVGDYVEFPDGFVWEVAAIEGDYVAVKMNGGDAHWTEKKNIVRTRNEYRHLT